MSVTIFAATLETVKTNNIIDNNSTNSSNLSKSVSSEDTVTYEINKLSEGLVNVKATKNGKTISKNFEMDAMIDKTEIIKIENIGEVVLVSKSGGEYYGIEVFRLSQDYNTEKNKEIKNVGTIKSKQ